MKQVVCVALLPFLAGVASANVRPNGGHLASAAAGGVFNMKTYGLDANGVHGGLQGVGGFSVCGGDMLNGFDPREGAAAPGS